MFQLLARSIRCRQSNISINLTPHSHNEVGDSFMSPSPINMSTSYPCGNFATLKGSFCPYAIHAPDAILKRSCSSPRALSNPAAIR